MTQPPAQRLTACNLFALLLLLTATLLQARRISSRRLVIHVPVKMKTHHHTHTVYKVLHGGSGGIKQTIYKVVGFDEGKGQGSHSHSHSYGYGPGHSYSHSHGMDHGEITYEDKHGCESGKLMPSHRDMLFNHYARHDQEESEATDYAEEQDEFIDVRDAWL